MKLLLMCLCLTTIVASFDSGDFEYKYHDQASLFDEALKTCINEGAQLFFPETEDEARYVSNQVQQPIWLGVRFINKALRTINLMKSFYCGKLEGYGSCVIMMSPETCRQTECSQSTGFVCKRQKDSTRCDIGYIYSKTMDRCYKRHETPADWYSAEGKCRSEGGSLLVLETREEADYIKSLGRQEFGFLGVHDMFSEGTFMSIHGDPLNSLYFKKFNKGEPNNFNKGQPENCIRLRSNFQMGDVMCDQVLNYYCEKSPKRTTDCGKCPKCRTTKTRTLTLQIPEEGFSSPIIIVP